MGKWCLHASSIISDRIIIKAAGNQDRHKSSDEFDFGPLVSMAHLYVFWNEVWPWHIGLGWATVALWATCFACCYMQICLILMKWCCINNFKTFYMHTYYYAYFYVLLLEFKYLCYFNVISLSEGTNGTILPQVIQYEMKLTNPVLRYH